MTEPRSDLQASTRASRALRASWAELERGWRECDSGLAELGTRTRRYALLGTWRHYDAGAVRTIPPRRLGPHVFELA